MIDPKELRIGNWIKGTPRDNGDLIEFQVYKETFFDIDSGYGRYEPIPITEEWLLRSGFEKISNHPAPHYSYKIGNIRIVDFEYRATGEYFRGWLVPFSDGDFFMSCKFTQIYHIHQLQNLIHALTGTELTFKTE